MHIKVIGGFGHLLPYTLSGDQSSQCGTFLSIHSYSPLLLAGSDIDLVISCWLRPQTPKSFSNLIVVTVKNPQHPTFTGGLQGSSPVKLQLLSLC